MERVFVSRGVWVIDEVTKAMNQPCDRCGRRPGTEASETQGYAYPLCVECKIKALTDEHNYQEVTT